MRLLDYLLVFSIIGFNISLFEVSGTYFKLHHLLIPLYLFFRFRNLRITQRYLRIFALFITVILSSIIIRIFFPANIKVITFDSGVGMLESLTYDYPNVGLINLTQTIYLILSFVTVLIGYDLAHRYGNRARKIFINSVLVTIGIAFIISLEHTFRRDFIGSIVNFITMGKSYRFIPGVIIPSLFSVSGEGGISALSWFLGFALSGNDKFVHKTLWSIPMFLTYTTQGILFGIAVLIFTKNSFSYILRVVFFSMIIIVYFPLADFLLEGSVPLRYTSSISALDAFFYSPFVGVGYGSLRAFSTIALFLGGTGLLGAWVWSRLVIVPIRTQNLGLVLPIVSVIYFIQSEAIFQILSFWLYSGICLGLNKKLI